MKTRCYSELVRLDSFEDRFVYLKLAGEVGNSTFGFDRHLNQSFYLSKEWKDVRDYVLIRDNGCDLGVDGRDIFHRPVVHHVNPMTADDILHGNTWVLDPEYLITTCHDTHNAIHYGDLSQVQSIFVERKPNDTKLW